MNKTNRHLNFFELLSEPKTLTLYLSPQYIHGIITGAATVAIGLVWSVLVTASLSSSSSVSLSLASSGETKDFCRVVSVDSLIKRLS